MEEGNDKGERIVSADEVAFIGNSLEKIIFVDFPEFEKYEAINKLESSITERQLIFEETETNLKLERQSIADINEKEKNEPLSRSDVLMKESANESIGALLLEIGRLENEINSLESERDGAFTDRDFKENYEKYKAAKSSMLAHAKSTFRPGDSGGRS